MEHEMRIKYIVLDLLKYPKRYTWIEKLMLKFQKDGYYQHLYKKLLFNKESIYVLGKHGLRVELPFDELEIKDLPKNYMENYISRILEYYGIEGCYLCQKLSFLKDRFDVEKKWVLQYLLFPKGIWRFLDECDIEKKDARFVIIDSDNQKVEPILQVLLKYANYLTIVTKRVDYFEHATDVVYEETGLVMDVISFDMQKNILGNVIINLDKEYYRIYNYFEKNASVIDFYFTEQKMEYLSNRRNDLTVMYDYEISGCGESYQEELIAEVIIRDNWKVNRFFTRDEYLLTAEEMEYLVKDYDIQIGHLKIIRNHTK